MRNARRLYGAPLGILVLALASAADASTTLTSLKGSVQAEDGTGLAGIVVVATGAGKEWRTTADGEGRFELPNLGAGRYTLVFLKGLGVGESLKRIVDIRRLGDRLVSDFLLVVWRQTPVETDSNLWEELREALRSAPRDGLKDVEPDPVDEIAGLEPVIEAASVASAPAAALLSGGFHLAQSFLLDAEHPDLHRGTEAGLSIDAPAWTMVSVNVSAEHKNGGSLTSPILTGAGVSDQELRVGVDITPSSMDRVEVEASLAYDTLEAQRGFRATEQTDRAAISNLEATWFRALPEGDVAVSLSYARGVLTLSGLPMVGPDTLSSVQSFLTTHATYTATPGDDHLVVVGGAFRDDHAPAYLSAWPGAYDDVAGLLGVTEEDGAATVYARDTWRASDRVSLRYGASAYYPVSQPSRAFAAPELGADVRLWPDSSLSVTGSYVYSPESGERDIADSLVQDEDLLSMVAELRQRLPEGAHIGIFAGTRDLRTLYLQATAGEATGDVPDPLFFTTGYAAAKETGVELTSAPMGNDATISLRYLRGRTDGAITVEPLALLRRDLAFGGRATKPARVGYSQALVAIAIPQAGTAVDLSFVEVRARDLRDRSERSSYSLWGGQVRQDLPFLDFREARFAVLVAANQVLQDLYRLDAISEAAPRRVQVSGGIALTF